MNIHFEGVSKAFPARGGPVQALEALDLTIADGDFFVFLGPSGCGKSTLLNLAAGLEAPSEGTIRFGERVVASATGKIFVEPAERNVAMVFQSYALYPHMSVFENIAFPLRNAGTDRRHIETAVRRSASMLGIEKLLQRRPAELSGGQRQRVAIARALVRQPDVFLLDEPLSNLDAQLRTATRAELKRLQADLAVTTLYVTHDQGEAMTLGHRVAVLNQGRLVQVGEPDTLYRQPVDPFVAAFIGSPPMNLIPARLESRGGEIVARVNDRRIDLPGELQQKAAGLSGNDVLLGIRPEHIRLADKGLLKGTVSYIETLGREIVYGVDIAGHDVRVLADRRDLRPGETAALTFDGAALHVFAA
jgi:multiple sugar transport system ATP-binding protein